MTRLGQFEEGKQTLAVGILESVILASPADEKHLLDMGNWIYGQTYAKLREARNLYEKHIWVNKDGKRVCIFPVMKVFEVVKEKPQPKPEVKVVKTMRAEIEERLKGFKPQVGNVAHIEFLKSFAALNTLYKKIDKGNAKKSTLTDVEMKERNVLYQLENLCGNPAQNQ